MPPDFLLYGLLALLGLWLVGAATVFQRVAGLRLRRPTFRLCPDAEVPAWLLTLAEPALHRLAELGFERVGTLAVRAADRQSEGEGYDLVLHAPASGAYAFVYALPTLATDRPILVDFATFFGGASGESGESGQNPQIHRVRLTLARSLGVLGSPLEGVEMAALPELSLARRYARHRFETGDGGAAAPPGVPLALTPSALAAELDRRNAEAYRARFAAGELLAEGQGDDGRARLRLGRALSVTLGVLRGTAFLTGHRSRGEFHGNPVPERVWQAAPPALAAAIHAELLATNAARAPVRQRLWIFAATLALFALTLAHRVEPLMLALLVAVVLFHELGHFLAMRALGYRDTTVYFLPFLGAAATGEKETATASERALVLLAGPVPGLVLGLALAAATPLATQDHPWQVLVLMLVLVNLLNLLPIVPLDGGRLLERAVLAGAPRAELAFKALSAGLLLAAGPLLSEWLLPWIGLALAAGLPTGFRLAHVLSEPPPQGADAGLSGAMAARARIYARIDAAGYVWLRFPRKFALAREVERRLLAPPASRALRMLWLCVYLACLFGGALLSDRLVGH